MILKEQLATLFLSCDISIYQQNECNYFVCRHWQTDIYTLISNPCLCCVKHSVVNTSVYKSYWWIQRVSHGNSTKKTETEPRCLSISDQCWLLYWQYSISCQYHQCHYIIMGYVHMQLIRHMASIYKYVNKYMCLMFRTMADI